MIYSIQQEGKNAYLRDLSRNVARGLRAKAEAAKMVVPCWGYRKDGLRLVPDSEIAPIVRRIFDEYLKPGSAISLRASEATIRLLYSHDLNPAPTAPRPEQSRSGRSPENDP